MQYDIQRVHAVDDRPSLQDTVVEYMAFIFRLRKREILRISCTQELQCDFHDFLASKLAAWQVVENNFTIFPDQLFAFRDT